MNFFSIIYSYLNILPSSLLISLAVYFSSLTPHTEAPIRYTKIFSRMKCEKYFRASYFLWYRLREEKSERRKLMRAPNINERYNSVICIQLFDLIRFLSSLGSRSTRERIVESPAWDLNVVKFYENVEISNSISNWIALGKRLFFCLGDVHRRGHTERELLCKARSLTIDGIVPVKSRDWSSTTRDWLQWELRVGNQVVNNSRDFNGKLINLGCRNLLCFNFDLWLHGKCCAVIGWRLLGVQWEFCLSKPEPWRKSSRKVVISKNNWSLMKCYISTSWWLS